MIDHLGYFTICSFLHEYERHILSYCSVLKTIASFIDMDSSILEYRHYWGFITITCEIDGHTSWIERNSQWNSIRLVSFLIEKT